EIHHSGSSDAEFHPRRIDRSVGLEPREKRFEDRRLARRRKYGDWEIELVDYLKELLEQRQSVERGVAPAVDVTQMTDRVRHEIGESGEIESTTAIRRLEGIIGV